MLLQPYSYLSKKPASEMQGSSPERGALAFLREKEKWNSPISKVLDEWRINYVWLWTQTPQEA